MPDNQEVLQQQAEHVGLGKFWRDHPAQFVKARAAAERLLQGVPRDFHVYTEPAHAFRASEEA